MISKNKGELSIRLRLDRELVGILALTFGILIIAIPDSLGYLVGIFLLMFGILNLLGKRINEIK